VVSFAAHPFPLGSAPSRIGDCSPEFRGQASPTWAHPGLCTASSTLASSSPMTSLPPRPLLRVVKRGTPVSATLASFTTRRRHAPWRSAQPARATSPSTPSASPARAQAPRPTPAPNRGPEHQIRLLRPSAATSTSRRRATPPAEPLPCLQPSRLLSAEPRATPSQSPPSDQDPVDKIGSNPSQYQSTRAIPITFAKETLTFLQINPPS